MGRLVRPMRQVFELEFDGLQPLYQAWRAVLLPEKRIDW